MPNTSPYPLIKIPKKKELVLFLIREELRARKFFSALEDLGFNDNHFEPRLSKAILNQMKMDDGKDETLSYYMEVIEKYAKKRSIDNESLTKQAMKVYYKLEKYKAGQ